MFEIIQHSIITLSMIYSLIMVVGVALYSLFLIKPFVDQFKWIVSASVLYWIYISGAAIILSLSTVNLWFLPIVALVLVPLATSRVALIPVLITLSHNSGRKA